MPPSALRSRQLPSVVLLLAAVAVGACAASQPQADRAASRASRLPVLDSARLLADVARLSHDSMAGRAAMTPENAKARDWLVSEVRRLGLDPVGGNYVHPFVAARRNRPDSVHGANVAALLPGSRTPERLIVVSAHYDHVGVRNGQIFNGADDNASGTAAVLALAAHFVAHRPAHSILFVFFDAEELGLLGARAFVANPPVSLEAIGANVNLDMVSRSDSGELYAAGAARYPQLRPILESLVPDAPVKLLLGHDSGAGRDDWTNLSDQGAFHAVGIPFVLFSVEDHADYHQPTDDVERINAAFFYGAVRTIAEFVTRLDAALPPR
ncbi:MAG: M28 family peptidase [Gemmatimonadaceae bacterium]